jgi:hypothetical protein
MGRELGSRAGQGRSGKEAKQARIQGPAALTQSLREPWNVTCALEFVLT